MGGGAMATGGGATAAMMAWETAVGAAGMARTTPEQRLREGPQRRPGCRGAVLALKCVCVARLVCVTRLVCGRNIPPIRTPYPPIRTPYSERHTCTQCTELMDERTSTALFPYTFAADHHKSQRSNYTDQKWTCDVSYPSCELPKAGCPIRHRGSEEKEI